MIPPAATVRGFCPFFQQRRRTRAALAKRTVVNRPVPGFWGWRRSISCVGRAKVRGRAPKKRPRILPPQNEVETRRGGGKSQSLTGGLSEHLKLFYIMAFIRQ